MYLFYGSEGIIYPPDLESLIYVKRHKKLLCLLVLGLLSG